MAIVTLRVLEGLERGKIYARMQTPVSIGREDDNTIQLNDDRVSRFHAKLQDDGGRVILTDLDSTNGTRVNGHPVQVKVLQPGDLLMIGRCVLLFGEFPDGMKPRSAPDQEQAANRTAILDEAGGAGESVDVDFLSPPPGEEHEPLFPHGAPPAPVELRPLHRAQVSDVLAYLHEQVAQVLAASYEQTDTSGGEPIMVCPREAWLHLVGLQATLAAYLKTIADPDA